MKKTFRFGVCVIAMLLAMSVFPQSPTFAHAAERSNRELVAQAIDWLSNPGQLTTDEIREIGNPNNQASALDATAFYNSLAAIDTAAFTQLKYELPTSVDQTSSLNFQYESMKGMMQGLGYGTNFEFNVPEMNKGYASDITTAFTETYGDLSHKYNGSVSLPEGWTMDDIMSAAQSKRDEYASDIKASKEYNVIKNNIANNTTVVQAIGAIKKPELQSALSIQSFITESIGNIDDGTWIKEEWSMADSANMDRVLQQTVSNAATSGDLAYSNLQDVEDMFNGNKSTINSWLTKKHQGTSFSGAYDHFDNLDAWYDTWFDVIIEDLT
jgi:hypothetical protein